MSETANTGAIPALGAEQAPNRLLTIAEVCDRLGITTRTGFRWIADGEFPHVIHLSRSTFRVTESALEEWLRSVS